MATERRHVTVQSRGTREGQIPEHVNSYPVDATDTDDAVVQGRKLFVEEFGEEGQVVSTHKGRTDHDSDHAAVPKHHRVGDESDNNDV